ncbi:hypothetical protein, partial [Pseudomonas sp. Pseusp97]|uniref:hypothetical protein n=1 Tax=Pseudomonas sp. Pseusp97 TaxID=3243065 RepID=UPI0039A639C3
LAVLALLGQVVYLVAVGVVVFRLALVVLLEGGVGGGLGVLAVHVGTGRANMLFFVYLAFAFFQLFRRSFVGYHRPAVRDGH